MRRTKVVVGIKKIAAALLGCCSGALNVLFGGGGGILAVPSLQKLLDLEERRAHASAVAVMLPLSVVSVVLLTMKGMQEISVALPVGVGASVGGLVGGVLLNKLPKELLGILFYGIMIYVGLRFLK